VFAKIAGRHQERQLACNADFKALVKAVAEEQLPDPEDVERILAESNKTLEDRQLVEAYVERIEFYPETKTGVVVLAGGLENAYREGSTQLPKGERGVQSAGRPSRQSCAHVTPRPRL
jgi:hypothetical protein